MHKQDYSTKFANLHSKLQRKSSYGVINMIKKLGTQVIFILVLSKYQITTLPFSPRAGRLDRVKNYQGLSSVSGWANRWAGGGKMAGGG